MATVQSGFAQLTIVLTSETRRALKVLAAQNDVGISQLAETLLRAGLGLAPTAEQTETFLGAPVEPVQLPPIPAADTEAIERFLAQPAPDPDPDPIDIDALLADRMAGGVE